MDITKQEILQTIYNKLRFAGLIRSKQDFAEKIGYNYTCTSAAMNGAERYLNDRFFTRILRAFPQVSEQYIRTGEGPVFAVDPETGEVFDNPTTGIQPLTTPNKNAIGDELARALATIESQKELIRRQQDAMEKAMVQNDKLLDIIKAISGASNETEE